MRVGLNLRALLNTKWWEYALRFLFGGTLTLITGIVAKRYGPELGGLFLAFPAIFPASATLVEKHQRERTKAGTSETMGGRLAAALEARGVAMGSIGLAGFALIVWTLLPFWNSAGTLFVALAVWLGLSSLIWRLCR
jgi:uncharacterized protein DUF3147